MENFSFRQRGRKVPARSKSEIEELAKEFRDQFDFSDEPYLPVIQFLETLYEADIVLMEIVCDGELDGDEARALPDESTIQLTESVYNGAVAGTGHSRFTIAHELGHLFLHRGVPSTYARGASQHKIYEDSEWQADFFAASILIDSRQTTGEETAEEIADKFGVSLSAAENYVRKRKSPKSGNF